MVKLSTFGIAVDKGVIPQKGKGSKFKLRTFALSVDKGVIPRKDFFHFKAGSFSIAVDHQVPTSPIKIQVI